MKSEFSIILFILYILILVGYVITKEPIRPAQKEITVPKYTYRSDFGWDWIAQGIRDREDKALIECDSMKPRISFRTPPCVGFATLDSFIETTSLIIESKEILRFCEDSIIIFFEGKQIVIKDDSLYNVLNEMAKPIKIVNGEIQ